jgi:hypothetical protein
MVPASAACRRPDGHDLTLTLTLCPVDAGGVPAEWVEATVATDRQPTVVYFHLGDGRPAACDLALATGARVLSVPCPSGAGPGVAAYTWLLGEGVNL